MPEIPEIADGADSALERPRVDAEWLILTEEEAARVLKVARPTFRKWAGAGRVPRYQIGGEYRYYIYDLLDLMEDGRQGA